MKIRYIFFLFFLYNIKSYDYINNLIKSKLSINNENNHLSLQEILTKKYDKKESIYNGCDKSKQEKDANKETELLINFINNRKKKMLLLLLEKEDICIHQKLALLEEKENKAIYDDSSRYEFNILAGGLLDNWD